MCSIHSGTTAVTPTPARELLFVCVPTEKPEARLNRAPYPDTPGAFILV